ncbi:hypothetical protein, partial [Alistipes finegoldii]|uniref:hypothetical protein n=1 Tax=Alistipes finegoldii TaxID=214856 RepID=UPI002585E5DF
FRLPELWYRSCATERFLLYSLLLTIELIHIGATKGHPKQRQIYIIICFHTTNSTIFFPFLFLYNKTTTQKQQKRFLFQDYSL